MLMFPPRLQGRTPAKVFGQLNEYRIKLGMVRTSRERVPERNLLAHNLPCANRMNTKLSYN